ncbi:hypothetical protein V3954_004638 [Enterobacter roggenkampii]
MPITIDSKPEIYRIKVYMASGITIEGFAPQGGDIDGYWLNISRTSDMQNATYINRNLVSHVELSENK